VLCRVGNTKVFYVLADASPQHNTCTKVCCRLSHVSIPSVCIPGSRKCKVETWRKWLEKVVERLEVTGVTVLYQNWIPGMRCYRPQMSLDWSGRTWRAEYMDLHGFAHIRMQGLGVHSDIEMSVPGQTVGVGRRVQKLYQVQSSWSIDKQCDSVLPSMCLLSFSRT